ncbi:hypothetical protein ABPG72_007793 [Tetrahymena utriculariae]
MDNEEKSSHQEKIEKQQVNQQDSGFHGQEDRSTNRERNFSEYLHDYNDDGGGGGGDFIIKKQSNKLNLNISQLNNYELINDLEHENDHSNLNSSQKSDILSQPAISTGKKPPLNSGKNDQKKEIIHEEKSAKKKNQIVLSKDEHDKLKNSFNIFDQMRQNKQGTNQIASRKNSASSTNSYKGAKQQNINTSISSNQSDIKAVINEPELVDSILNGKLCLGNNLNQQIQNLNLNGKKSGPPSSGGESGITTPTRKNNFNNQISISNFNNLFQQNKNNNSNIHNNSNISLANSESQEFNFIKNDPEDNLGIQINNQVSSIKKRIVNLPSSASKNNDEIKCNQLTIVINNSAEKHNNNNVRPNSETTYPVVQQQQAHTQQNNPQQSQTNIQNYAKQLKIDRSKEEQKLRDLQGELDKINTAQDQYKNEVDDIHYKGNERINEFELDFEKLQLAFMNYKKECDQTITEKDHLIQQLRQELNQKNDKILQQQLYFKQSFLYSQYQMNFQDNATGDNTNTNSNSLSKLVSGVIINANNPDNPNIIHNNQISSNNDGGDISPIAAISNDKQPNSLFNSKEPIIINKRLNLDIEGGGDDEDQGIMQTFAEQGLLKNLNWQGKGQLVGVQQKAFQIRQNYLKQILGEIEYQQICEMEKIFDEIMRDNKSVQDLRMKYSNILEELIKKLHQFKDKHEILQQQLNELQQNCVKLREENQKISHEYKKQMQKLNELKERLEKVITERDQTCLLLNRYEKKEIITIKELQMEYYKKEEDLIQCQEEVDNLKNQIDQLLGIVGMFDSEKELAKQMHNESIQQFSIVLNKYDEFIMRLFQDYCHFEENITQNISSLLSEIIINVHQKEILDRYESIKRSIAQIYNKGRNNLQTSNNPSQLPPLNSQLPNTYNFPGNRDSIRSYSPLLNANQLLNQNIPPQQNMNMQSSFLQNTSGLVNGQFITNNVNKSSDYQYSCSSLDKNPTHPQIDDEDEDANEVNNLEVSQRRLRRRDLEEEIVSLKGQLAELEKKNNQLVTERMHDYDQMKEHEQRVELFKSKLEQKITQLKEKEKQFIQMVRQITPEIDLKDKDEIDYFEIKNQIVKKIQQDLIMQQQQSSLSSILQQNQENQSETFSGAGVQKYLQELNNSIQQIKQISYNTNQILSNTTTSAVNPVTMTNFLNTERSFALNSPNKCNCFKGDKSMINHTHNHHNSIVPHTIFVNPSPVLPSQARLLNHSQKPSNQSQQNFQYDQMSNYNSCIGTNQQQNLNGFLHPNFNIHSSTQQNSNIGNSNANNANNSNQLMNTSFLTNSNQYNSVYHLNNNMFVKEEEENQADNGNQHNLNIKCFDDEFSSHNNQITQNNQTDNDENSSNCKKFGSNQQEIESDMDQPQAGSSGGKNGISNEDHEIVMMMQNCPYHQNLINNNQFENHNCKENTEQLSQYTDLVATSQQQQIQINTLMVQLQKSLKLICDLNDRNILEKKKLQKSISSDVQNNIDNNIEDDESTFYIQVREKIIELKVEEALKKKYAEYDQIRDLVESQENIKLAQKELQEKEKLLNSLSEQLKVDQELLEQEKQKYKEETVQFEQKQSKLTEEILKQQQDYKEQYAKYLQDFQEYQNLMKQLSIQKDAQEGLQNQLSLRSSLIKEQQEQLDKHLLNLTEQQQQLKDIIVQFDKKKEDKNELIEYFKAQCQKQEEEIKQIKQKYEEIQKLTQEINLEKEIVKREHALCQNSQNQFEIFRSDYQNKISENNNSDKKELEALNLALQEKDERITEQKEMIKNLNQTIKSLESKIENLSIKSENYDEAKQKLEQKNEELILLKQQVAQEQKEKQIFLSQLNDLKAIDEKNQTNFVKKEEQYLQKINELQLQFQNEIKTESLQNNKLRDEYQGKIDEMKERYFESSQKMKEAEKISQFKDEQIKQLQISLESEQNTRKEEKLTLQKYFEEQLAAIISHLKEDNEKLKQLHQSHSVVQFNDKEQDIMQLKTNYALVEQQIDMLKSLMQNEIAQKKNQNQQNLSNFTVLQLFEMFSQLVISEKQNLEEEIQKLKISHTEKDSRYLLLTEDFAKYKDQIVTEMNSLKEKAHKNDYQTELINQLEQKNAKVKQKCSQLQEKLQQIENQMKSQIFELEKQKQSQIESLNNKILQIEQEKAEATKSIEQTKNQEIASNLINTNQKISYLEEQFKQKLADFENAQNSAKKQKKKISKEQSYLNQESGNDVEDQERQIKQLEEAYQKLMEQHERNQTEQQQEMKRQYDNIEEQIRENLQKQMQLMQEKYERSMVIYENQIKEEQSKYRELRQSHEVAIKNLNDLHFSQQKTVLDQSNEKVDLLKQQLSKYEELFQKSVEEQKQQYERISQSEIQKGIINVESEYKLQIQSLQDKLSHATEKMQDYETLLQKKEEQQKNLIEEYDKKLIQVFQNDIACLQESLISQSKQNQHELSQIQNAQKEIGEIQETIKIQKLQENNLKDLIQQHFSNIQTSLLAVKDESIKNQNHQLQEKCNEIHQKILSLLETKHAVNNTTSEEAEENQKLAKESNEMIKSLHQKISEKEAQISQLNFKCESLNCQIEQIKELKKLFESQKDEIIADLKSRLQDQLTDCSAQNKNDKALKNEEEKNVILQQNIEELKSQTDNYKIKVSELETQRKYELQMFNEKKQDLENTIKRFEEENKQLKVQIEKLNTNQHENKTTNESFVKLQTELNQKTTEVDMLKEQIINQDKQFKTEKIEIENKFNQMKETLAKNEQKMKQLEEKSEIELQKLQAKNQKISSILEEAKTKSEEIVQLKNEQIKLQAQHDNTSNQLEQCIHEKNELSQKIQNMSQQRDSLEEQKNEIKEKFNTLKETLKHTESKLEQVQKELEQAKQEKTSIQAQSSEKIKSLNDSMVNEFYSQNQIIEQLKDQISKLSQIQQKQHEKIQEVENISEIKKKSDQIENNNNSLQQQIFRMQEEKEQITLQTSDLNLKLEEQRKLYLNLIEENGKNKETIRSLEEKLSSEQLRLQKEAGSHEQLKSRFEQTQINLENVKIHNKELEILNLSKENRVKELLEQYENTMKKYQKQKQNNQELKLKSEEQEKLLNQTEIQIKDLEEQLRQMQINKRSEEDKALILNKQIDELKAEIKQQTQTNETLNQKISQVTSLENPDSSQKIGELQQMLKNDYISKQEYDVICKKFEQKNKDCFDLEQRLEKELQNYEQNLQKIEEKFQKQQQLTEQKYSEMQDNNETQHKRSLEQLKEKHEKFIQQQQIQFEEEREGLQKKCNILKEKLANSEDQIAQLEQEKQKILSQNKSKIQEYNEQQLATEQNIKNLQESIKQNLQKINEQEELIKKQEKSVKNCEEIIDQQKEQINELQKSLKQTHAENEKQMQELINNLNQKISVKESECNSLQQQLIQIEQALKEENQNLVAEHEKQIKSLNDSFDLLNRELATQKEQEKCQNEQISKLESQVNELSKENQEKIAQIEQIKDENSKIIQMLKNEIQELESSVSNNKEQIQTSTSQYQSELSKLKEDSEQKLALLSVEIQKLQENIAVLTRQIEEEQTQKSQLIEQHKSEIQNKEKESVIEQNIHSNKIQSLEEQLRQTQKELDEKKLSFSQLEERQKEDELTVKQLQEKLSQKQEEVVHLQTTQNATKEEKISILLSQIQELEKQLLDSKSSVEEQKNKNQISEASQNEAIEQLNSLEQKYSILQQNHSSLEKELKQTMERNKKEKDELIQTNQQELSQVQKEFITLNSQIEKNQIDMIEKDSQIKRMSFEHEEIQKQLDSLKQKYQQSLEQLQIAESEITQLKKQVQLDKYEASSQIEQLKREQNNQIDQINEQNQLKIVKLQSEFKKSSDEALQLKQQIESLQAISLGSNNEMQNLMAKVKEQQEENVKSNQQIAELQSQLVKGTLQASELNQKISKLESKLQSAENFIDALKKQENQSTKSNFGRIKKIGVLTIDILDGFLIMYQNLVKAHSNADISSKHNTFNFNTIIATFRGIKNQIFSKGESSAKQLLEQINLFKKSKTFEIISCDAIIESFSGDFLQIYQVYQQLEKFHDNIKLFLNIN